MRIVRQKIPELLFALQLQAGIDKSTNLVTLDSYVEFEELTIIVKQKDIFHTIKILKEDFDFEQLIDITAVDYSEYGVTGWQTTEASKTGFSRAIFDFDDNDIPKKDICGGYEYARKFVVDARYAVVYHLLSVKKNSRIRVKIFLKEENLVVDTITTLYKTANWFERETFDMFGILFQGHNDLRRILTDYGFIGHPLRKDFPLEGKVEMIYDEEKQRLVYVPVSIKNRVNIPKIIRNK